MVKKIKKTRQKAKPFRRARLLAKLVAGKKKSVKKPKKKVRILKFKKKVIRKKSKKSIIRKKIKRVSKKRKLRKIIKRKPIKKKKPAKKLKRVKPRKKMIRKIRRPAKKRKFKKVKFIKPRVYVGKGALEQLFESQAKVKLLKFFFRNSNDIFQPKEIFKRLRSNISLLRQEMNRLENIGVIKQKKAWLTFETKRGRIRKEKKTVYYLNPAFDFVNELRNLILKSTISSKDDLVNSVRKLGNIKLLVLAGLFTGDEAAKADLLIVGDKINSRKLNNFLKDLEAEVGKELNCAIMSNREFSYRYDMYDRFVRDLISGKSEILINRVTLW